MPNSAPYLVVPRRFRPRPEPNQHAVPCPPGLCLTAVPENKHPAAYRLPVLLLLSLLHHIMYATVCMYPVSPSTVLDRGTYCINQASTSILVSVQGCHPCIAPAPLVHVLYVSDNDPHLHLISTLLGLFLFSSIPGLSTTWASFVSCPSETRSS